MWRRHRYILCLWGAREGHFPESLPSMPWPCLAESKSDLQDMEFPLLDLDGSCPLSCPG